MISRSKVEHILCLCLNGLNITVYSFIIVAIIFKCKEDKRYGDIIAGIYAVLLALLLIMNETRVFELSTKYFRFLTTHRGRGLIIIFFGCLVLDTGVVNIVIGTLVIVVGSSYIALSYLSQRFPQPNPLTVNWRIWKDFSAEGLDLQNPRLDQSKQCVLTDVQDLLKSPLPYSKPSAV